MKKTIWASIMTLLLFQALASFVYSEADSSMEYRLPTTPEEIVADINKDMSELYDEGDNYYKMFTSKGYLRVDLLRNRLAVNNNNYEMVYGSSHGPWLQHRGGMYAYSGYTRFGESVSTDGAPWYAGWSGTKIQNFNMVEAPWDDSNLQRVYMVKKNGYDGYRNTKHKFLASSNGTFEQAILVGLNYHYAGKKYSQFMYQSLNDQYKDRVVYDRDAKPKGGDWVKYVHVLQPPTYLSWGEGRIYIKGASGAYTYLGIPIAPFILLSDDLSAQFEALPSGAVEGEEVLVGIKLNSSFTTDQETDYAWNVKTSSGEALAINYAGHAKTESGLITIPANGERLLYASFTMPKGNVTIGFTINKDKNSPKEASYENNVLPPAAIKLVTALPTVTGEYELDYNVLKKIVTFPLSGGAAITAHLSLPSQSTWDGNAFGALHVNNLSANVFRSFTVSNNPPVNEAGTSIVRKPVITTSLLRSDFGDDPKNRKWLNWPNSNDAKLNIGTISFEGAVTRNYIRTLSVCTTSKDHFGEEQITCTEEKEPGSTSAPFSPGVDVKNVKAKIYNGIKTVPAKTYKDVLENNTISDLRKSLFWTNEPYAYDVIRWMANENENGKLYEWTTVPGQYKRTFIQQARGEVNWQNEKTMEQQYKQGRDAARKMTNNKTLYDKAVFATDKQLQKYDYPIKSGYYFNPAGVYTFTVETETFKQTQTDTKDHKDLVNAVIDSFRYETDLIYINNKKVAVNIFNEPLGKKGNAPVKKAAALSVKEKKGVDSAVLLTVIDRSVEDSRYSKSVEEIYHSEESVDNKTHPYWKLVLEGYPESSTLGSFDNFKYREYVESGQKMYKIKEKTKVSIIINKDNTNVYTHAQMPNGEYYVQAWIDDLELSNSTNAYKTLGKLVGIKPLDAIKINVTGSMYDDLNN
ncbi:hypothetical protein FHS15_002640 [Paenibacillus castaneae]|uniref:hypothetical protein n=1 Tax=Paenibacillus castaneae TaxID=474957 RepID=UPI000C9AFAF7|nr:hypothetical protein [Paenibacillus castaneae]NIK77504.1 hypothetical protein [Paenibacillus castaneae]